MRCLHILETNPLLVASFAYIFSHSGACLFILFLLPMQKFLSLIRSHLKIFPFILITLGGVFKKILLDAWGWCTGTTQRDGMGREEGGGFRMGNTCIPVADSF